MEHFTDLFYIENSHLAHFKETHANQQNKNIDMPDWSFIKKKTAADLKTEERKLYAHATCMANSCQAKVAARFILTKLLISSAHSGIENNFVLMV